MLPGRGDRAATFISNGFQNAGENYGFDTIAADAHFGYFRKRTLVERLHADIVLPAREAGYKKIWLLGISAGGFGSILYASQYPDEIDGVILLAPFLGEREAIDELVAGGGLATWSADGSELKGLRDCYLVLVQQGHQRSKQKTVDPGLRRGGSLVWYLRCVARRAGFLKRIYARGWP